MSMKRPWYKRYPDHFIAGTVHLTFEQKAAYSMIIDLIYASDGRLMDDDTRISRVLGVRSHYWKRLKKELESLGKLRVNSRETPPIIEFVGTFLELSPDFPPRNPLKTLGAVQQIDRDKNKNKNKNKSAGAREGVKEAPMRAAPPEKKPDKGPTLSEEERTAYVAKLLGRMVQPGRVERPEFGSLLNEMPKANGRATE